MIIATVLGATAYTLLQPALAKKVQMREPSSATSGNNMYIAWTNNETGHWQVFFARSIDNGKTFDKTVALSDNSTTPITPQITASASNVYVIWWGDKTGYFEPVLRVSTDNGATFGKIMKLNGTSTSGIPSR
jgi:hypothetical protein